MFNKKFYLSLLLSMICCVALVGCGGDSSVNRTNRNGSSHSNNSDDYDDSDDEEADDEETDDNEDFEDDELYSNVDSVDSNYFEYSSKELYEAGVMYSYETTIYTNLCVYDDMSCRLDIITDIGDGSSITDSFPGTAEHIEGGYIVSLSEYGNVQDYRILVDGSYIVENERYDKSLQEIVGTTSCIDSEYGEMTLDVFPSGEALLHMSKNTVFGRVIMYDGTWDFLSNSAGEEETIDWLIFFSGDSFTYIPFDQYLFGKYEGSYKAEGDLGTLVFDVDSKGHASTVVKVDGKNVELTGTLAEGEYGTCFYLSNSDGSYTLEVTLYGDINNPDSEFAYDGYVTERKTLSVG